MRRTSWINLFVVALAYSIVTSPSRAAESQIIAGDVRFTIITPNLIRIEQAAGGAFTDAPTMFAIDRSARFADAKINRQNGAITIDTPTIKLVYKPDGTSLGPSNLTASIKNANETSEWRPGVQDSKNLGGTIRTLDQIRGPVNLGRGLISRSGYAIVDDSGKPILENGWAKARPQLDAIDWYLFGYGHDYKAALRSLAAISGKVPLPRKNMLGLWYSRYWPYSSDDYRKIVKEYDDHDFPLDNIVMDMDWHLIEAPGVAGKMIWTGYTVNQQLIPDLAGLITWFHSEGMSVALNDHPAEGVQPHEAMYSNFMRAMNAEHAAKKTIPFDAGDKHYLDTFWNFTHAPLNKIGVDIWWLDWQQYPFTKSIATLQNLAWLNKYYFEQTSAGGKRGASLSRWAGWGDHRYPIEFSGDADTGWPMLAFEVPFTSTAGNVGCFFWSHDIGGHMGGRNEESYTRWCQFGALSAALRSHSSRDKSTDRRPWNYPDWAETSMRGSFHLRSELMPYIYSSVAQTCDSTVPLIRPMYMEFPELDAAYRNGQEYLFGDNLLVAPIASPGAGPSKLAWQTVWFPSNSGHWFDYFTGERHEPNSEAVVACDINTFPLFVRGGAPLVMQPYSSRPTTTTIKELIIRCYPGDDNQMCTSTLYEDDGQTDAYKTNASASTVLKAVRNGSSTTLTIAATQGTFAGQLNERSYLVQFPCLQKPLRVTIDGQASEAKFDEAASTIAVTISSRSIRKETILIVNAQEADAEAIRRRATSTRLAGIVGHAVDGATAGDLLKHALASTNEPTLRTAALAALGTAIVRINDSPYFFGGNEAFVLKMSNDNTTVGDASVSLTSAIAPDHVVSLPAQITSGRPIDLNGIEKLFDQLRLEDSVSAPGRSVKATLAYSVNGERFETTLPASATASKDKRNLARLATISASSTERGYTAEAVADGVADGYPSASKHEWSSNKEKAGATITLTWKADQSISQALLYDRPNAVDNVLAGRLVFSDGSQEDFGALPADGKSPLPIKFSTRRVRWMRVEITGVSPDTENAGLSEVAVFK